MKKNPLHNFEAQNDDDVLENALKKLDGNNDSEELNSTSVEK